MSDRARALAHDTDDLALVWVWCVAVGTSGIPWASGAFSIEWGSWTKLSLAFCGTLVYYSWAGIHHDLTWAKIELDLLEIHPFKSPKHERPKTPVSFPLWVSPLIPI